MEIFKSYIQIIKETFRKAGQQPQSPILQIQYQLYKLSSSSHLQILIQCCHSNHYIREVGEAHDTVNHIWNGLEQNATVSKDTLY